MLLSQGNGEGGYGCKLTFYYQKKDAFKSM